MYNRTFKYNITTGLYDIVEEDITFSMPLEMTRLLKKSTSPSIMDWYKTELTKDERKLVNLNGYIKTAHQDNEYPNG